MTTPYTTRYHGTPYAHGGETGPAVATLRHAQHVAHTTLHRGQWLDVFGGHRHVARYAAGPDGTITKVTTMDVD